MKIGTLTCFGAGTKAIENELKQTILRMYEFHV